jgi:hypothetical protein
VIKLLLVVAKYLLVKSDEEYKEVLELLIQAIEILEKKQ